VQGFFVEKDRERSQRLHRVSGIPQARATPECGGKRLSITAVEGAPRNAEDLRGRVEAEALLRGRVQVIQGLAGERSGSAYISDDASHYANMSPDG
jgi:hypothetical protein